MFETCTFEGSTLTESKTSCSEFLLILLVGDYIGAKLKLFFDYNFGFCIKLIILSSECCLYICLGSSKDFEFSDRLRDVALLL